MQAGKAPPHRTAQQPQAAEHHQRGRQDVYPECKLVRAKEVRLAADQKLGIEVERKVVGVSQDNADGYSQDQEHHGQLQDPPQFLAMQDGFHNSKTRVSLSVLILSTLLSINQMEMSVRLVFASQAVLS